MKSIERELEELRARVARLEAELSRLVPRPAQPPALPGSTASAAVPPSLTSTESAPPVIATIPAADAPLTAGPAAATASRTSRSGWKLGEVSSTVWIAAAGAVIFLLGAIYALTVSIERGWISPPVRVAAGLLFSLGAGIWAARLLFGASRALGVTLLAVAAGTWTFSLYFGAKEAHLFAPALGFVGAAMATLLAGGMAARVRSDGAMAVALATGLVAPLAFSTGTGTVAGLSLYLAGLLVAQLVAHYATGVGADWKLSRALALGLMWLVVLAGAVEARLGNPLTAVAALSGLLLLALFLAWMPRHPQSPAAPAAASVFAMVGAACALWAVWTRQPGWWREGFAVVLVVLAGLALVLVPGARRRADSHRFDLPLILTAAGLALIAVPVAVEWRWLAVAWGVAAVLATSAAVRATAEARDEARGLRVVARVATSLATTAWLFGALAQGTLNWPLVNRVFVGGLLAAGAWGLLIKVGGKSRAVPFVMMQVVAVNALAWELARVVPDFRNEGMIIPVGALLATLVFAAAGAGQWLRGVLYETEALRARALRLAGYGWLIGAAGKLLLHDLGQTDLVFRALVTLGVGAIFIGAALWADRHRATATRQSS